MILQVVGSSERGKEVSKTGNEFVIADITINRNFYARLAVFANGDIVLENTHGRIIKMNASEFSNKMQDIEM